MWLIIICQRNIHETVAKIHSFKNLKVWLVLAQKTAATLGQSVVAFDNFQWYNRRAKKPAARASWNKRQSKREEKKTRRGTIHREINDITQTFRLIVNFKLYPALCFITAGKKVNAPGLYVNIGISKSSSSFINDSNIFLIILPSSRIFLRRINFSHTYCHPGERDERREWKK